METTTQFTCEACKFAVRALLTMITVMLALAVNAISAAEQDSNIDLHAAYCVGTEEELARFASEAAAENTSISGFHERMAELARRRLVMLHKYLDTRSSFVRESDIETSRKQGFADSFATHDPKVLACTMKCRPLLLEKGVDPVHRCMAPCDKQFPRIWSCKDLSWLPN